MIPTANDVRNVLSLTAIVVMVLWASEKSYKKGYNDALKKGEKK